MRAMHIVTGVRLNYAYALLYVTCTFTRLGINTDLLLWSTS